MPDFTAETAARLRELHEKATPGPWSVIEREDERDGEDDLVFMRSTGGDLSILSRADAHFIAEMRNALPALLDRLAEQDEKLAELEGAQMAADDSVTDLTRELDSYVGQVAALRGQIESAVSECEQLRAERDRLAAALKERAALESHPQPPAVLAALEELVEQFTSDGWFDSSEQHHTSKPLRKALARARQALAAAQAPDKAQAQAPEVGTELIAAERRRQVEAEGWCADHDDEHSGGELRDAAVCYAVATEPRMVGDRWIDRRWPWEDAAWKPSEDPVRNLVKAGALIAAEIDRHLRERAKLSDLLPSDGAERAEREGRGADPSGPKCATCGHGENMHGAPAVGRLRCFEFGCQCRVYAVSREGVDA